MGVRGEAATGHCKHAQITMTWVMVGGFETKSPEQLTPADIREALKEGQRQSGESL